MNVQTATLAGHHVCTPYVVLGLYSNESVWFGVTCFDLHERTASGSHQAEHRERVNDEAHLLVGQQRVDKDEAHGGQQQHPRPLVKEAERDEEQRAAEGTGHSRVKVPQKGRGLLGR